MSRDCRLPVGRLARCRSSPWGWFSSRDGSCSEVGEIHRDDDESRHIPANRRWVAGRVQLARLDALSCLIGRKLSAQYMATTVFSFS